MIPYHTLNIQILNSRNNPEFDGLFGTHLYLSRVVVGARPGRRLRRQPARHRRRRRGDALLGRRPGLALRRPRDDRHGTAHVGDLSGHPALRPRLHGGEPLAHSRRAFFLIKFIALFADKQSCQLSIILNFNFFVLRR